MDIFASSIYRSGEQNVRELFFVRTRTCWNSSFLFSSPGLGRQRGGVHVSDSTLHKISNIRRKCTGTDNVRNVLNVFVGPFVQNL